MKFFIIKNSIKHNHREIAAQYSSFFFIVQILPHSLLSLIFGWCYCWVEFLLYIQYTVQCQPQFYIHFFSLSFFGCWLGKGQALCLAFLSWILLAKLSPPFYQRTKNHKLLFSTLDNKISFLHTHTLPSLLFCCWWWWFFCCHAK